MRKFTLWLLILATSHCLAQTNKPTTATGPGTVTPLRLPTYGPNVSFYYQRTFSPSFAIQDTGSVNMSMPVEMVKVSTRYYDELGRPIETVARQVSAAKSDLVAPLWYDEFGRPSIQYMPYTQQTGNINDGLYKNGMLAADSAFYKSQFVNEQVYYGQQQFDGSPLNIPTKTMAPGNSWSGSGRGVSFSQRANTTADSVRLWTIAISSEDDVPATTQTYAAGSLMVQQITDEKGNKSVTYTDENGKTILTKVQLSTSPTTGHAGWLCTYYVYDEMNHVRLLIPPKAVEALNNATVNWNLATNAAINTNLCYGYWYDSRGRTIMSRVPGKGKTYAAFDKLDRQVMSQDANLRITNQWAFIIYDGQSRPRKTGLITSTLLKDTVIAQAAASTAYPTLTGSIYTTLSETFYDDYSWVSTYSSPVDGSLVTTNINSTNFNTAYNSSPDFSMAVAQSNRLRGAVTGSKRMIVGTGTYLWSSNIFDEFGRVIQTKETNYTGGTDVSTIQYNFSGQVLRTHVAHQKSGTNAQTHTLLTKYSYDHVGRPKTTIKNIDSKGDKIISQFWYNELGQLASKNFGTLEVQTYWYNIRGWLSGINAGSIGYTLNSNVHFAEALSYDYGFDSTQYNGSISGIKWQAAGDGITRSYGFGYDKTGRLNFADFNQQNSQGASWTKDKVDYAVSGISYDAGGNILAMKQRGLKVGSSSTVDSLTYQYFTNSNQLQKVSDAINDNSALGDFKDTSLTGDDYVYDAKGNTVKDYNRHMHTSTNGNGMTYNFLDKPDSIVIAGKGVIKYVYDAGGNQLQKTLKDDAGNKTVLTYISGFVYKATTTASGAGGVDTLQYVLNEVGQIRNAKKINSSTGATYFAYEYDYFIKDHLGNIRTVLTEGSDTATYAATMEAANATVENKLFDSVSTTQLAKPAGFDTDTSNHYVSRLNANTTINKRVGPAIVLKVMAGDKLTASTYAWYNTPVQSPGSQSSLLNSLSMLFADGVLGVTGKYVAAQQSAISSAAGPGITSLLTTKDGAYNSSSPKAFLNWVLLDNQFKYVTGGVSQVPVINSGTQKQVLTANIPTTISKNGYLYIYVSNESPQDVYFDNVTIKHYTGPLQQEQDYYPFNLPMAEICDKALLKQNTPYKGNGGVELEEDFGVQYYNTLFRKYDPQIGRFSSIDLLSEKYENLTPYNFAGSSPIILNDPSGANMRRPGNTDINGTSIYSDGEISSHDGFINILPDATGGIRAQKSSYTAADIMAMAEQLVKSGVSFDALFDATGKPVEEINFYFGDNQNLSAYSFAYDDAVIAADPACYVRDNLKLTMVSQSGQTCLPTILSYIDKEVFGGKRTRDDFINLVKKYITDNNLQVSTDIETDGVNLTLNQIKAFVGQNFDTKEYNEVGGVIGAVNSGYPIVTTVSTPEKDAFNNPIYHAVAVIGYQQIKDNYKIIYMDPAFGRTYSMTFLTFNQSLYVLPITNAK